MQFPVRSAIQHTVCGESGNTLTRIPGSIALTVLFREKKVSTPSASTFEMVSIADRRRQREADQADPHHPHRAAVPCPCLIGTSPPTK